ncbi:MAG: hypothetical protein M3Y78_15390 [Pseudomonadota bacterium]|nr:hypothetical protein [Pseudomonadota bacterium]
MQRKGGQLRSVVMRVCAAAMLVLGAALSATPVLAAKAATAPKLINICHGYGCAFRSKLVLGAADGARFRSIMRAGAASPKAERAALSKAVSYFDRRANQATGFKDRPKTAFGKPERGQMDCVDESTNTRALLLYLAERGLLKFHKVGRNVSRGFFIDGRYPHFTAILIDPSGVKWVVDPWNATVGGRPDIFPHEEWKVRGQFDIGALD